MSKRGQNEGSIRQRKDGTWEARSFRKLKQSIKPCLYKTSDSYSFSK